jgi:hypothetical protein
MQYTIRNVPPHWTRPFAGPPRKQGKSLNQVAIEALARGAGLSKCRQRDLSDIAGSWQKDFVFDSALAAEETVDGEL